MDLIKLAKDIATMAHAGQVRRDGVTPYIAHPARVAMRLRYHGDSVIAAAWLHDVLEDTTETPESLIAAGVPSAVVSAVVLLTKTPLVSYDDYIAAISKNTIASNVKVADILDNLSDAPTNMQILKYAKSLLVLCG